MKIKKANVGLHARRLHSKQGNIKEQAFAEQWEHEHQFGDLLAQLLMVSGEITERDRIVAATVVQWLGSSVGQAFIYDTNKREKNETT